MDITEKNGQPSMEEILASIRRIIAEEPSGPYPVIDLKTKVPQHSADPSLDDSADFDLPSIFRPSAASAADRPAPLFGRLTDAIRGASSSDKDSKATRNGDDKAAAPVERGADVDKGAAADSGDRSHLTLSSLRPTRSDPALQAGDARMSNGTNGSEPPRPQPAQNDPAPQVASPAPPKMPAAPIDAPRVMVPFRDMRMVRMSTYVPPSDLTVPPVAPPAPGMPAPHSVDFGAFVPGHMEELPHAIPETSQWVPQATAGHTVEGAPQPHGFGPVDSSPAGVSALAALDQGLAAASHGMPGGTAGTPPPIPYEPAQQASGGIEDATAELLRPMLRQWLADNMPRMVEKALHIEVAESVRSGKKPTGT